jgi:eukaryotic-like serine/threonine-protein kinase
MREAWKEWEGRVVNKEFRLGEYLGGSERAAVFLTQYGPESRKAAVKLIPVGTWDQATAEAELSRLHTARELSHPHLLQIFQAGRATLDDTELLFVVMEYAEEDLSQILPNRPLAAAEVREVLRPTLDALGYLHGKGFVHGHLNPANVMASGDQVKLSSDGISSGGERRGALGQRSDYDAPEIAQGGNWAASDVWSLGMLLVMALTRRLPSWDATREEPILPEGMPSPFDEVVRHCLRRDPRARGSLAEIAASLGFGSPAEPTTPAHATSFDRASTRAREARAGDPDFAVAKPDVQPSAMAPRAAVGPQLAAPQRKAIPAPPKFTAKRRSNAGAYVAAAVVLVIVGILVVPRLFRDGSINSQTDSAAQERPTTPARAPARANSGIAQVSDQGASAEAASETNSPVAGEKPEGLSGARGKTLRRGLTAGQVAEQVLPDVPLSARDTIHGTVRVRVRISVDSSGSVTEAELDSSGPSKYFAHLALEAAQQWKFEPPKMQGRNVLSDWLLHFQFTEKGTKVIPVQSDP